MLSKPRPQPAIGAPTEALSLTLSPSRHRAPHPTLDSSTLALAVRHFERHEGVILHPYLDSKGLVTIGVGFLYATEGSFIILPLFHRESGVPASEAVKRAAWRSLCRAAEDPLNHTCLAHEWRDHTDLEVSPSWVRMRLGQEIQRRAKLCMVAIGTEFWRLLTEGQKLVATDIHYANGSLRGFPSFVSAARRQDAQQMALESLYHSGQTANGSLRRNWGRIVSNYALCLGFDSEDSKQRRIAATQVAVLFAKRGLAEQLPAWLRLLVGAKKQDTEPKS